VLQTGYNNAIARPAPGAARERNTDRVDHWSHRETVAETISAMRAVIGRIDSSSTKILIAIGGIYQDIQKIVLMPNITPSGCLVFKPRFQALIGE
jgi:hypothetical protein